MGLKKEFKSLKTNFRCLIKKMIKLDLFLLIKKTPCDEVEMENDLPDRFYKKMLDLKESLMLDLTINTFERECLEFNELLVSEKLFFSVYELKKKFRFLIHSDSKKTMLKEICPHVS